MPRINILVQNQTITIKYKQNNKIFKKKWEDRRNISRSFLVFFDKIFDKLNNCNKNQINCHFIRKSDSLSQPMEVGLRNIGNDSTTERVVLASLQALDWAHAIKLVKKVKPN